MSAKMIEYLEGSISPEECIRCGRETSAKSVWQKLNRKKNLT